MRNEDLIPIFADELATFDRPKDAKLLRRQLPSFLLQASDGDYWESDTAHEIMDELFQRLDECAPPHVQFSAHEGDGADYGWWPTDFDGCHTVTISDLPGQDQIFVDTECDLLVSINDHGNITVQELGGNVIWTCV